MEKYSYDNMLELLKIFKRYSVNCMSTHTPQNYDFMHLRYNGEHITSGDLVHIVDRICGIMREEGMGDLI